MTEHGGNKKVKTGPVHQKYDRYRLATTPDESTDELSHLIQMTPKDYVVDFTDEMEHQLWIARMLGELHTVHEIVVVAKQLGRKGVTRELVCSVRDHTSWKEAIKKMRTNFLVDEFKNVPLAHTTVRIRELTELYYKLMGKYPVAKFMFDQDGTFNEVNEEDIENADEFLLFDKDSTTVEIHVGGKDGQLVKVKKQKYFEQATKILEQIRLELEKADLTLTSEAEFINIIRECGFEAYEP